eukprot:TRINITY_DN46167_c0_g1_i1.p2 TRINITY_DN46167_c0_g1~~TRINITY_DN46167_c0_g1_i1.p2  ORF type:complete len:451 (+),score=81.66 TRINITY_DN46167_c0_g1_i1:80-1432(+)
MVALVPAGTWQRPLRRTRRRAEASLLLTLLLATAAVDPNYPPPQARSLWCSVPNYRHYRFTPQKARGFAPSDTLSCALATGKPDGCFCISADECRAGFCIPNALGAGECRYPVVQLAEIEFWRKGQRVNTAKVPDDEHSAFRVVNGVDVPQTWGVWELEFYTDTTCTTRLLGGTPIASSERARGFGHSVDHTAPRGLHNTARTYWQATQEAPHERFELHGPAAFAFDGREVTNWWAACENPCRARTEWLGLSFGSIVPGVKCVRILQDKDRDYASFSLTLQGQRENASSWDTFAKFNAATWEWGGVWEKLSVPQGVAFNASIAHARLLDFELNSSVIELVGTSFDFDFGVETEIDAFRWATTDEPTENTGRDHDGYACDRDGLCPRDPVRWTLQGSLDGLSWVKLLSQDTDYPVTIYRRRWLPFLSVRHRVSLSITDIWPGGGGQCAARR